MSDSNLDLLQNERIFSFLNCIYACIFAPTASTFEESDILFRLGAKNCFFLDHFRLLTDRF